MAGVEAIQGVDDTLRDLAKAAVASLVPRPKITVSGLDLADDELRLNWFLYRVGPNLAFRNMEPPQTGWHTARGRPPLALRLSDLLTAHPAKPAWPP
jgi:Pvc16 N-terminal domain